MTTEDDPRLVFVPVVEATAAPPGLCEHIKDHYWVVHPEKGIVYYCPYPNSKSKKPLFAQANSNKELALDLTQRLYPWAMVQFFPSVFRRADPRDY